MKDSTEGSTVEERVLTEALILMAPFHDFPLLNHAERKKCALIVCDKILENLLPFDNSTIRFYEMVKEKLKT